VSEDVVMNRGSIHPETSIKNGVPRISPETSVNGNSARNEDDKSAKFWIGDAVEL
jgi:hypothetical protein